MRRFAQLARVVVVDIDESRHAIAGDLAVFRRLAHAGAREIADRFRAVLVAAFGDHAVELGHEFVVESDGYALHTGLLAV